jgi:glycosyltransferase involved in cell wall biosynthesis
MEKNKIELSIVMPCLNEEETIGACVEKAMKGIALSGMPGEVIVADNGSTDLSIEIAKKLGAIVVNVNEKGYGNAYKGGLAKAQGKYIIMGDSDDTYDFSDIAPFISKLKEGYDLIVGSRLKGDIKKGAMPFLHRYVGTPVIAFLLNLFFKTGISDPNGGMRGLTKEALEKMSLQSGGMEFASEMIINASREGLKITEVPIPYYARKGESKLNTFRDGWRHLRFMLFFAPTYLFLIPGFFIFILGITLLLITLPGPFKFGALKMDIHFQVLGSALAILGSQTISTGLFAKCYAYTEGYEAKDRFINIFLKLFTLERGIYIGVSLFLAGLLVNSYILLKWVNSGFGALSEVRTAMLGLTLVILGVQAFFSSFFISILILKKGRF